MIPCKECGIYFTKPNLNRHIDKIRCKGIPRIIYVSHVGIKCTTDTNLSSHRRKVHKATNKLPIHISYKDVLLQNKIEC